jgi:hypothetical protein
MHRYLLSLAGIALFLAVPPVLAIPQPAQIPSNQSAQDHDAQDESTFPTVRVTTREVLVDLIALDHRNQSVLNLKPGELQVSVSPETDATQKRKKQKRHSLATATTAAITHLSIVDPNNPLSSPEDPRSGFRLLASCLERSTVHYLVAFHPGPDSWTSGHHRIVITTDHPGIKLFYRHGYYVGLSAPDPGTQDLKKEKVDELLRQSACYYPVTPLSITLQAHLIDAGRSDVVRYQVSVDASSLSFLTLNSDSANRGTAGIDRRIELDYATCNFNQSGDPVSYFHAPLEQVLTSADYARAMDRGFPHILEFPASDQIAMTRVVLRDRATGNLGAADLALPHSQHAQSLEESPAAEQTAADLKAYQEQLNWEKDIHKRWSAYIQPAKGPIGSFGSIVPSTSSFCGDVYELPLASRSLPDFRELDPIGALYTSSLDVPNQTFSNTSGIPGVTPRTNLFGIDYHATFWVKTPGEYRFFMASDDGAILQIDDKKIIDLDGLHSVDAATDLIHLDEGLHTIHVPYYQGAVFSVALELWVVPPGQSDWILFNLKDYAVPPSSERD